MQRQLNIWDGEATMIVDITQEKKDKVFDTILNWLGKHNCTSGESLCQNDDTQIEAPQLLADIVDDIIQPIITYKDGI